MIELLVLAAAVSNPVQEGDFLCAMGKSTVIYDSLEVLPAEIRDDIVKRGRVAGKNQPFQESDEITMPPLPQWRFVSAGKRGSTWFVWLEHGGFARHYDVFGYEMTYRGMNRRSSPELVASLSGEPCAAVNAILNGVWSLSE